MEPLRAIARHTEEDSELAVHINYCGGTASRRKKHGEPDSHALTGEVINVLCCVRQVASTTE